MPDLRYDKREGKDQFYFILSGAAKKKAMEVTLIFDEQSIWPSLGFKLDTPTAVL